MIITTSSKYHPVPRPRPSWPIRTFSSYTEEKKTYEINTRKCTRKSTHPEDYSRQLVLWFNSYNQPVNWKLYSSKSTNKNCSSNYVIYNTTGCCSVSFLKLLSNSIQIVWPAFGRPLVVRWRTLTRMTKQKTNFLYFPILSSTVF